MDASTVEPHGGAVGAVPVENRPDTTTEIDMKTAEQETHRSMHAHTESMTTVRLSTTEEDDAEVGEKEDDAENHNPSSRASQQLSIDLKTADDAPTSLGDTPLSPVRGEPVLDETEDTTHPIQAQEEASTLAAEEASPQVNDSKERRVPEPIMTEQAVFLEEPITESLPSPTSTEDSHQDDDDSTLQNVDSKLESELGRAARPRSTSTRSSDSSGSEQVDWVRLDSHEEREERDEGTDESTAFLLARLEQENAALATDPKANVASKRERKGSRPPSMQQIKKLATKTQSILRYSTLPSPPPMTELEFWTALVRNYPQTAQRLPTLTSNKIRSGIPPPLRGVVWMSIAGARDTALEETYEKLCRESSPYEKLIHKDIGRSFPGVDMFRDPGGEGQQMLGKVLNAFSLYDQDIGYCQGLGFVVGPLLMHMGDKEAFCTLVRLMDHYDLRSCFLPSLTGLHLRIYQFQQLLSQHLPELTAHLEKLNVEPLYISQWFLSFFGVTCPLPMLIRLYDVILTEGASETLMRVALSLMRRNEKKILAATEFEDIMQLLLSRALWDTYNYNADELISDFCNWTGLVTRESLQSLEISFKESQSPTSISKPSVHTAAQRFLGRLWITSGAGALISPKSPSATSPLAPLNNLRRTPSKQSMASTLNSIEGSEFSQASASTDATAISRRFSTDFAQQKAKIQASKDRDLHGQIEDLLTALSSTQREQTTLADQLQKEREDRDEDRLVVNQAMDRLRGQLTHSTASEEETEQSEKRTEKTIAELEEHFALTDKRSSLATQTKHQLREEVARWKTQYAEESSRTVDLSRQLSERDRELNGAKDDLREARSRIQEAHKDKQRLEKANQDLRARKTTVEASKSGASTPDPLPSPSGSGLRELKLGRASTASANLQPQWTKRVSSLSANSQSAEEEQSKPVVDDALLMELANVKTSEAMAKQELEEVKTKLESFRKLMAGGANSSVSARTSPPSSSHSYSLSSLTSTIKIDEPEKDKPTVTTPAAAVAAANMVGGFFSGWGKRAVSSG